MSLRLRFFLSHALAVGLASLALLATLWVAGRYTISRQISQRHQTQAAAFWRAADQALRVREQLPILNMMRQLARDPAVAWVAWSRDGVTWLSVPSDQAPELAQSPREPGAHRRASSHGREVVERVMATRGGGRLSLAHWQEALEAEAARGMAAWRLPALAAVGAAFLVGLGLALYLAAGLAKPLRAIAQGTQRVRRGELESLVEVERRDEIGALAREFNAMTQELSELDRLKRDFVAGVSHDLGTPLQSIQSAARLLERSAEDRLKPKESDYLLTIMNGSETLLGFVRGLLDVAKIQSGRVDPYLETCDLAEQIRTLAKIYEPQAQEKGLAFEVQTPERLEAEVDLLQFKQMAGNLLSNAVKFTDQGSVQVGLKVAGAYAALSVRDTGIGVDPRHQALIFDRFYRVRQDEGAPQRQGSGLGLAIVKGLAEAHGGQVSVSSEKGKGATFTLLLPLHPLRGARV